MPKVVVSLLTRFPVSSFLPTPTSATCSAFVGCADGVATAPAAVCVSAAGVSFFAQPTAVVMASASTAASFVLMVSLITSASGGRWKVEHLSGMYQVRILDLVAVRVEDGVPLVRVPVHVLRDLREAVS